MHRKIIVLIMLTATLVLNALTLDEAKQQALQSNSRYLAQKNAYASGQWAKQQALGSLLPSLSLNANYVFLDPATEVTIGPNTLVLNHDIRSADLTLSQPLFMGGKLWQSYKINSTSAEIAGLNLENTRLQVLGDVETKYLNVLQLQELMSIAQKDLTSANQDMAIALVRYDSGTISQADYLRFQSVAASKQVTLIQAQTALELSKQDLANTLGIIDLTPLQPLDPLSETAGINTLAGFDERQTNLFTQTARQLSGRQNLSLQTVAGAVKISRHAYSIARGSFLPTVILALSRSFEENGLDRYHFESSSTLLLTASVPLLPFWNTYSGARKAYYDVRKSEQDYQTAANGINLAASSAALNLLSTSRQVTASATALQYTEQAYLQMQERFRNNLISVTDMLDAEVMLQAARISNTNAFYNYLKARTALLLALGTDDEARLTTLIQATEE